MNSGTYYCDEPFLEVSFNDNSGKDEFVMGHLDH
jgi:hypothetical protein